MRKLLMLILCLGMAFAVGACGSTKDSAGSNSQTGSSESIKDSGEVSESGSEDTSEDSSGESVEDSSEEGSGDSSEDSSTVAPPIINGENETPLVPIG